MPIGTRSREKCTPSFCATRRSVSRRGPSVSSTRYPRITAAGSRFPVLAEHIPRYDVIVIGGGAAGLMCAMTAGQRGRRVLVVEHANRIGKKILLSGGG